MLQLLRNGKSIALVDEFPDTTSDIRSEPPLPTTGLITLPSFAQAVPPSKLVLKPVVLPPFSHEAYEAAERRIIADRRDEKAERKLATSYPTQIKQPQKPTEVEGVLRHQLD